MRETTGRLQRATDWDRANGYAVISEAVWRVTLVDATLMRYQPDIYNRVLAHQDPTQRRITEDTFAGLRFIRNRMGYDTDPADFIQPPDSPPGVGRIATWTWRPVPEPALGSLTPRARDWEMTRYRAYQAQLAGQPIGETFAGPPPSSASPPKAATSSAPSRPATRVYAPFPGPCRPAAAAPAL